MQHLTPAEIVQELDRHIVGQSKAKRSVAIALRNRWRRQQVTDTLREEIIPNNIIMIGPTGVGKTEIARRLADLAQAPFIKVEASKFTEVGYVGRDVESMIRDLTDLAINMVKQEHAKAVEERARAQVEERILQLLVAARRPPPEPTGSVSGMIPVADVEPLEPALETSEPVLRLVSSEELPDAEQTGSSAEDAQELERLRQQLADGELEEELVELELATERSPIIEVFSPLTNIEEMSINIQEIVSGMAQQATRPKKFAVGEARSVLLQEETQRLIDHDGAVAEAIDRVQESGIVFLDEIDKVATSHAKAGPDISREGVQRDLLPIIEGSTVTTKYGIVHTQHILFIAAGAFHISKPSDLIPELQGRFPIRVELDSLGAEEFVEILTRPKGALIKQYTAMLGSEGVELSFTPEAIRECARIADEVNQSAENIGARRLHTVMSTLLDEVLFDAPGLEEKKVRITKQYVRDKIQGIIEDEDLSRYVL
jgi:ATP-dependent HslUV protease ATP-binding subunit HslU